VALALLVPVLAGASLFILSKSSYGWVSIFGSFKNSIRKPRRHGSWFQLALKKRAQSIEEEGDQAFEERKVKAFVTFLPLYQINLLLLLLAARAFTYTSPGSGTTTTIIIIIITRSEWHEKNRIYFFLRIFFNERGSAAPAH
jgi:hypothetical protein